jgi:S-formylglutathione hydrolase FrmB
MMIGGEFNTPADWLRAGNAAKTIDDLAAAHGGNTPVFVFVDSGGAFNNDTECVNGSRGNAADHLTKDVVPFMVSRFGVRPEAANWGVVGWSMGGTCALDLTVMHPELFSSFVDISGNLGPETGTKAQTIARLFGGNADAWAAFDPATVIAKHGRYKDVSGWFDVSANIPSRRHHGISVTDAGDTTLAGREAKPGDQIAAAESLCELGRANGINCTIVAQPGNHDWPFASNAFAAALPWLAGRLGTPGVPRIPSPPASAPIPHAEPVGR